MSLPTGLNTPVGEHGVSLSGGEQQRIAIARALYYNPEIIILDEATSALDSGTEAHIKHAISKLKHQGKTIIIIAHRLSTVMHAEKICVLKNGELVEEGMHHELMHNKSFYYNMWQVQYPLIEEPSLSD